MVDQQNPKEQAIQYLEQCAAEAERSPDGVARPGLEALRWVISTLRATQEPPADEREKFESFLRGYSYTLQRDSDGDYTELHVELAFEVWNARARLSSSQPKGEDLVGVLKAAQSQLNQLAYGGFGGVGIIPRHYKRTWESTVATLRQIEAVLRPYSTATQEEDHS